MIRKFMDKTPIIENPAFIADNAEITGETSIKENASIWYNAVLRGDISPLYVGKGSNIQDGVIMHTSEGIPCIVKDYVTVGHGAILHSCTVGSCSLIGMGAIILDKSEIGEGSIVGAGSLVTKGKIFPPHSLIMGSPAKAVRTLTEEEIAARRAQAEHYIELAKKTAGK